MERFGFAVVIFRIRPVGPAGLGGDYVASIRNGR